MSSASSRSPVGSRRRRPATWVALAPLLVSGCAASAAPKSPAPRPAWASEAVPVRVIGAQPPSLDVTRLVASSTDRPLQGLSTPEPLLSAEAARCPTGMALVDDRFCIDRWEATLLVRRGSREEPHTPYEPVDAIGASFRAVSAPGVVPQGYVSGAQAQAACRASGKRLCTADEWETACRGAQRARFPYGNDRRAKACNDDVRATHPVVEAAHKLGVPASDTWKTGMNLALVNQLPDGLLPTGAREACVTTEGAFDMVGNLHEWIADPDGTFRGGFYMDTTQNGEGCAYQTTAHDANYHDYSTGFRCCARADEVE